MDSPPVCEGDQDIPEDPALRRRWEDVKQTAELAKLDMEEMIGPAQTLYFPDDINESNYLFVEFTPDIVSQLKEGNELYVRGNESDTAIVCSADNTYEMKSAETSNALLLLPDLKVLTTQEGTQQEDSGSVTDVEMCKIQFLTHHYYELKPCHPRLNRVRTLLSEALYRGPEYEVPDSDTDTDEPFNRYTFDDLLDNVQASQTEIRAELDRLQCIMIDGFWRMPDFDYKARVLMHVISLLDEKSWHFTSVPSEECITTLVDLEPRFVIEYILRCFGDVETDHEDTEEIYRLDEFRVCRFLAEYLLRTATKFNLSEFVDVWQQTVPDGMHTDLTQLRGLGLIDHSSTPQIICFLPLENLPEEPQTRFDCLFSMKSKWTEPELKPYLSDLVDDRVSAGVLLQKYTRNSTGQNGVRVYTSKRQASS